MTADSRLVCRRCGFSNVPGDQFCGSCGAFLEWEGEPVGEPVGQADAPTQPVDLHDPDVPLVRSASGVAAGQWTSSTPEAPTPPGGGSAPATDLDGSPTQPYPPTPPDAGLIRCPGCGIANAATRTFCQSCGTKLAEAQKVGEVSRDRIVAAVSAPVGPRPVPPGPPRPVTREPAASGGGVGKWLVIMAVLGVLVGAGAVAASMLLRGEGPSSDATTNPSIGASGAPSGQAQASGEAPASAEAGASGDTGAPAAPEPEALVLTGAAASSVVGDQLRFAATRAIDGDPDTCWQEGNKAEKGEWIEVTFAPSTVAYLMLTNGYNASPALYRGNRRLKDVEISIDGGTPVKKRLDDTGTPQKVNVADVAGATTVRITILTTYPGKKTAVAGTPFDDAALGEIVVVGIPGG